MRSREDYESEQWRLHETKNKHKAQGEKRFEGYSGDDAAFARHAAENLRIRAEHESEQGGRVSEATAAASHAASFGALALLESTIKADSKEITSPSARDRFR